MTVSACAAKCEKYGENTVSYGYSAHQRTTHSTLIANQAPSSPPKTLDDLIPPQYHQFRSVFEEAPSRQLPPRRPWDHPINLQPDTPKEFKNKVYPLPPKEEGPMNDFINDMLSRGYIRPSQSPIASP